LHASATWCNATARMRTARGNQNGSGRAGTGTQPTSPRPSRGVAPPMARGIVVAWHAAPRSAPAEQGRPQPEPGAPAPPPAPSQPAPWLTIGSIATERQYALNVSLPQHVLEVLQAVRPRPRQQSP
jgi:hypothetical protein